MPVNRSILRDIFYGKYIPYENIAPKDHPKRKAINSNITNEKNYFRNMLSEENYVRLEKLEVLYTESSGIEAETAYIAGFRLGVIMMAEVYAGNENVPDINKLIDVKK